MPHTKFGQVWTNLGWIARFTQKCSFSVKNSRGGCFRPWWEPTGQILARLDHFVVNCTIHPKLLWLGTYPIWRLSLVLWSSPHAQKSLCCSQKACLSCKTSSFSVLVTVCLNKHNFWLGYQIDELFLLDFWYNLKYFPFTTSWATQNLITKIVVLNKGWQTKGLRLHHTHTHKGWTTNGGSYEIHTYGLYKGT